MRKGLMRIIWGLAWSSLAWASGSSAEAEQSWPPKSMDRPRPEIIRPPEQGSAPSDAIVLFDGSSFDAWDLIGKDAWNHIGKPVNAGKVLESTWKLKNGYMEIRPPNGDLTSKREFGDCQIHIEWATPSVVTGEGQGRGNSGVLLVGQGEIQILDSYQNDTYPDGQAGAIYKKYPPLVNASRKPGEWQSYDIVYIAPKIGKEEAPAQLTVFHNGILIQYAVDPGGSEERIKIRLQGHNNPVRYRNIWVREL